MNSRTIKIDDISLGNNLFIKTSVFHQKAGMNYATYKMEAGGYYLSVKRVKREERAGMVCESFMLFNSGFKSFVQEGERFSAKKLSEVAAAVKSMPIYQEMIEQVKALPLEG